MAKTVKVKDGPKKRGVAAGRDGASGEKRSATRGRADGRHQILLYMRPELIADVKAAALEEDMTAFRLVEKAVTSYLARRRKS